MYKILLFLILLFNVSYAQLFPRSVQYWHLADAVKDSLLARGVADDTTELKSKTFPIDGSIVYLRGLTSGDIVGNGLFYQDNFAYTKDKFNYFDNATGGKQWIRANYRTYVSPTSPSDGLKLIGLGVNRAANIGFYSGDSTRWRIGAEGEADTNNFVIFRYDDDGSFLDKPFEIERSTGTLYLNPDDGDTSNTPVAQRLHSVLESAASSGNNVNSIFRSNQAVANSGNIQGLESYVKVSHPSGTVNLAIAGVSNIEPAMASGRTLSIARSHQAGGNLTGAGTVTTWAAYYAQPFANTGGGTITNGYGLYVDDFPSGVTNMYGVYIKDADADNYFAGNLLIDGAVNIGNISGLGVNNGIEIGPGFFSSAAIFMGNDLTDYGVVRWTDSSVELKSVGKNIYLNPDSSVGGGVGIGIENPDSKLTVNGDEHIIGDLLVDGNVTISGGTINNTIIGVSAPAQGTFSSMVVEGTFHADDYIETDGQIVNSSRQTLTLGIGATTINVTKNIIQVTAGGDGNTIATITGSAGVGIYTLIFTDAFVIITDTDAHTANTVDLSAAFTSADDTVLTLVYDGISWYEISRSVN